MSHDFPRITSGPASLFRRICFIAFAASIVIAASFTAPRDAKALSLTGTPTNVTGVRDLDVNGVFRDFDFIDGTCVDVFGTCATGHFDAAGHAESFAIAKAFRTQLFPTSLVPLDTNPGFMAGCSSPTTCGIFVPFEIVVAGSHIGEVRFNGAANLVPSGSINVVGQIPITESFVRAAFDTRVWAREVSAAPAPGPTPTPVPEPATTILLVSSLPALFFVYRRRMQIQQAGTL